MLAKRVINIINKIFSSAKQQLPHYHILYYPAFENNDEFSDQIYRISWYFPENSKIRIKILTTTQLELLPPADYFFKQAAERIPGNITIDINGINTLETISPLLEKTRLIASWKNNIQDQVTDLISKKQMRAIMVDKNDPSRREAFEYAKFLHDLEEWPKRKARTDDAQLRFNVLKLKYSHLSKCYVFGTGPSLQDAYNFDFSDGLRIVCNSIVKNRTLLEHIKPHIIVAGDPLFHFGCSEYAEKFRTDLTEAINKYDCEFFYPFFYSTLFESHYPELTARSYPIPQKLMDKFNLDLSNGFVVKGTDNILTLLMLPLAATLANEIYILGTDGRNPDENYFWKHNPQSQYNDDLMNGVKACHPGFFDHVVYEDYYEQHCDNLEQLLAEGEALDKKVYSMTNTFIPALLKRAIQL